MEMDPIHFGEDGWRAIKDKDYNDLNLARAVDAVGKVFSRQAQSPRIYVGYDCREGASRDAIIAATMLANYGFDVKISKTHCQTPALCQAIAQDPLALGGVMLTSGQDPVDYLGIEVRMDDGGASPKSFTDRAEAAVRDKVPEAFEVGVAFADAMQSNVMGGLPFSFVDIAAQ